MNNVLVLILIALMSGCSSVNEKQMKKICNYSKAFNIGFNDAKENKGIEVKKWVNDCPEETQAKVVNGYRSGYFSYKAQKAQLKIGQKEKSANDRQCIKHYDKEICGYNCVEAFGEVRCARSPEAKCFEYKGEIVCGYKCREVLGDLSCARYEKR